MRMASEVFPSQSYQLSSVTLKSDNILNNFVNQTAKEMAPTVSVVKNKNNVPIPFHSARYLCFWYNHS